jgi:hypothetical protein
MQAIQIFNGLHETLQNEPGSLLITTRRLTHKWQHETFGVTKFLNEARSSVPRR